MLACIALATLVVGGAQMVSAQEGPGAADLLVRGGELFQANCAACHGTAGRGGPGPGVLDGPPIVGVDLAFIDLTMRTGRMPIVEPSVGVRTDRLSDDEREAVLAYLVERFDPPGEIPEVGEGEAARGQEMYVRNCAACHGAAADGGISGANVRVPPLRELDGIAIAEATRVGPFEMPAFTASVLDDDAIDDIVAYLALVDETPRTLIGVRELDQIGEALFALGLAMLAAVVVWIVARVRRWSPAEPEGFHTTDPFEPR